MAAEKTIPVRLPDGLAAAIKRVAAIRGVTPGHALADAWEWWWNRHGDQIVNDLAATLEAMRP